MRPQIVIDGATAAHAVLVDRIRRLTADEIRRPSLLTGWTVGHVLTHLARNAGEQPLGELVFRRCRETEVHHADLGLAFGWAEWSGAYVDHELDRTILGLAARLPEGVALRIEAEGVIGPWG